MEQWKLLLAAIVFMFTTSTHAVTVFYQPAPLPNPLPSGVTEKNSRILDGWLNNYYPAIKTFQNTSELKIGG